MSSYQLTPKARAELLAILDYVATDSGPDRADGILDDILKALELLGENPGAGHLRADLTSEAVRFWSVRNFLIVYRSEARPIQILHVVSGWRDVEMLLEDPGSS